MADEETSALIRIECAERRESDEFLANAMRKQDDVRATQIFVADFCAKIFVYFGDVCGL